MSAGIIGYDNAGVAGFPSPAVWADCPNTLLTDKGQGYFVHRGGDGGLDALPGLRTDSDSETYAYDDGTNVDKRTVNLTTGATDNNAAAMFTSALAKIVKNSGTKLWAEVDLGLAAITDQALFFGLADVTSLGSVRDVVADDPSNSGQAGLADQDLVGFVTQQNSSSTDKVDAVYRKSGNSVQNVLTDVGNASAFTPGTATGVAIDRDQVVATKPGDLTADEMVRYGVVFDGRTRVKFFVNGLKVAEQEVDNTFPQDDELGAVLAIKTGAASSRTLRYRFFRAAAQLRS